jgi:hypothetical protein
MNRKVSLYLTGLFLLFLTLQGLYAQGIISVTVRVNGQPVIQTQIPLDPSFTEEIMRSSFQKGIPPHENIGWLMQFVYTVLQHLISQFVGTFIVPPPSPHVMPPKIRIPQSGGVQSPKSPEDIPIDSQLNANAIRSVLALFPPQVLGRVGGIYAGLPRGAIGATDGHNIYLRSDNPRVVAHELGHILHFSGLYPEFNQAIAKAYQQNPGIMGAYGSTSIYEFAAETIALYITNREELIARARISPTLQQVVTILDRIFNFKIDSAQQMVL